MKSYFEKLQKKPPRTVLIKIRFSPSEMKSFIRLNRKMAEFASLQSVSSLLNLSRVEILKFSHIVDQMDLQTKNSDMSENV